MASFRKTKEKKNLDWMVCQLLENRCTEIIREPFNSKGFTWRLKKEQ